MLISHYTIYIYLFLGFIAAAGLYYSRIVTDRNSETSGEKAPFFWILTALSVFSVSLVQFWIIVLPIVSLESSVILITLSLLLSVVIPWTLNFRTIIDYYENQVPRNFKRFFSTVLVIFFAVLQPFALLYIGERMASQYLGTSYHMVLASVIGIAGLSTLIGGKKVILFSNALFGATVIVSIISMILIDQSVLAPMRFFRSFFVEGSVLFQSNASLQANWIAGFVGVSVISWFVWWIDHAAYQRRDEQSTIGRSVSSVLVSGSLIATALMFRSVVTTAEIPSANETLSFLFVLIFVSVTFSTFSHSFQSISSIVTGGYSGNQLNADKKEKHLLIAQLAIMLSALLVILVIPFAEMLGAVTLVIYVEFLSGCASTAIGTLAVVAVRNTISHEGIFLGIAGGMASGIIIAVVSGTSAGFLMPILETPYGASGLIVCSSALCATGGSLMTQKKMLKRSIVL